MADPRPLPPAPGHGPIFLMGAMGSGTTLLRLILDSHPNIAVPQETGFMRAYNAHVQIPFKWSGRNWAKRLGWEREDFDRRMAEFYDGFFQRYVEKHGKQRWGEKTPLHTFHIDDLARLFPESPFIGILRHPGGSVNSNMQRWKQPFKSATYHYERYSSEILRQAANYGDRFLIIRYEDMVLRQEPVLRELLDWLGEPWADEVLQHHQVQGSRGERMKVEGQVRVDDPIDVSRIDKWTHEMDEQFKRRMAKRLGSLAEFVGYRADDPSVLEPLNDRGSFITSGTEIDVRIDRMGREHLRDQYPVPRFEQLWHPRDWTLEPAKPRWRDRPPKPEPKEPTAAGRLARRAVMRLPRKPRRKLVALAKALRS